MNKNPQTSFEVKDSNIKEYIIGLIGYWLVISIILIVQFVNINDVLSFFIAATILYTCCVIFVYFTTGTRKSKFFISNDFILFSIENVPFLRIAWKILKEIEIETETLRIDYANYRAKFKKSYKIIFIGKKNKKVVRLGCLDFHEKKQELIINLLTQFSKEKNKKISSIHTHELLEYKKKCSKILLLRRKIRHGF